MSTGITVKVEHNGTTYDGTIGTIKSTHLGDEDHGIVTAYVHVEWPGGGIGVGGYCLDKPLKVDGKFIRRQGTAYGLDHLMQIMATVGVDRWEKLPGKQVIVLFAEGNSGWGGKSVGLAGTTNGQVFVLAEHAETWKNAEAAA